MTSLFDRALPPQKLELRPYQVRAIEGIRASLKAGNRRVVLMMATGAGKTRLAAEIVGMAREKGSRVIFTVPAISLIDQTVAAFEREGIDGIGVMQASHPRTRHDAPVQIASVQTLVRREVPPASLVIVDECHIRSKAIEKLMAERPGMVFIGLSATPWAKGMGKTWQDLVIGATTSDLIAQGYLSPFRVFAAAHPDLTGVKMVAGDYHEGQLAERMSQGALCADVVTTWLEKGENRPTLLFAVNRAHAAQLHAQFERAGIGAAYVDMDTDRIERQIIERDFRSGAVKVACSVRTLTTGIDWPVACIIDAAPTRSEMLHVQKIGRGLRVNPPWDDCVILDHSDNSLRLGFVTDIHHTALDDGSRAERAPVERKEPLPKECGACGYLKPAKTRLCPGCGHEAKAPPASVETVDGELVELRAKPKAATIEDKQSWLSGLTWIANQRGYKTGWAARKYRDKFGVWPHHSLLPVPAPPTPEVAGWVKAQQIRWAKSQEKQRARA